MQEYRYIYIVDRTVRTSCGSTEQLGWSDQSPCAS